jgi:hypothetical protein
MNLPMLEPEVESVLAGVLACGKSTSKPSISFLLYAVVLKFVQDFIQRFTWHENTSLNFPGGKGLEMRAG